MSNLYRTVPAVSNGFRKTLVIDGSISACASRCSIRARYFSSRPVSINSLMSSWLVGWECGKNANDYVFTFYWRGEREEDDDDDASTSITCFACVVDYFTVATVFVYYFYDLFLVKFYAFLCWFTCTLCTSEVRRLIRFSTLGSNHLSMAGDYGTWGGDRLLRLWNQPSPPDDNGLYNWPYNLLS